MTPRMSASVPLTMSVPSGEIAVEAAPLDAVIIAAGFGSRLRDLGPSKPLTLVEGIALLEIGIRQAAAAGIRRVTVVTGHEAERVEAALPLFARRAGIAVRAARIDDWSRPNGHSVMAGTAQVAGPFLLMMADHIFSTPILRSLTQQGSDDRGVTLAIDRRVAGPFIDPEDATWVRTHLDGRIEAIGKTIASYDAVDCGAFLATDELRTAIARAIAEGRPGSLSDGMQILAEQGRAATMDIGGHWWIDVDDPHMHGLAGQGIRDHLPDLFRPAAPASLRPDASMVQHVQVI